MFQADTAPIRGLAVPPHLRSPPTLGHSLSLTPPRDGSVPRVKLPYAQVCLPFSPQVAPQCSAPLSLPGTHPRHVCPFTSGSPRIVLLPLPTARPHQRHVYPFHLGTLPL